jgi:hypothetical protein
MDNYSISINMNGTPQKVHVYREAVVAWAIHTSKNRKEIMVERIVPLTVDIGCTGNTVCRWDAQPDQDETTTFVAQFDDPGMAGSVRFVQPEPGTRLVVAYVEGVGACDLGIELPGAPLEVPSNHLKERVASLIAAKKRTAGQAAR